jgi:hypothetical protein
MELSPFWECLAFNFQKVLKGAKNVTKKFRVVSKRQNFMLNLDPLKKF